MKKGYSILCLVALLASGCSGKEEPTSTTSSTTGSTTATTTGSTTTTSTTTSTSSGVLIPVTDYVLTSGVYFTGILNYERNQPADGEGSLRYENSSIYTGTFENGLPKNGTYVDATNATNFVGLLTSDSNYVISYIKGKLTFENGQYYEGKFVNNLFEDEDGFYSYHTIEDEVTTYSYTYRGGFVAGLVDNQIGKLTYPASFKSEQGLWYIEGEMETFCKPKSNATVKCKIRWPDAYYEGEAYYDGYSCISNGKGTTVFDNTCRYEGEYKDGNYHGVGVFYWPDGTRYEGNFAYGSPNDCTGTIHYPCENKGEGVWYFTGIMSGFVQPRANQIGIGKIKYGDLTTYTGQIRYNGTWVRMGEGVQDFLPTNFPATNVGGPKNLVIDKYVGSFNEDKSGWIYGNGIYYYCNSSGQPVGWSKAFWYGLDAINDYQGEFDPSILLSEYKNLPEYPITTKEERAEHYVDMYKGVDKDIMFIGDSYLEMWRREYNIVNYEGDFEANYSSMNLGIGGTVFKQWTNYLFDKMAAAHTANKIVIHLGTNDIHMHLDKDIVIANCEELINKIILLYPDTEIYLLTAEPTPSFRWSLETEMAFNAEIKTKYASNSQVTVVDTASHLMNGSQTVSDLASYYISDGLHMNAKGYEIWVNIIKSAIGLK